MLRKWKKPKAFFLAVTEGKFHNRVCCSASLLSMKILLRKLRIVWSILPEVLDPVLTFFLWVQIPSFGRNQQEKFTK